MSPFSRLFKKGNKTQIFLTGATGYLGGTVLARLLHHKNVTSFDITVLVRDADKAKTFQSKFGVNAVVGSHEEHEKIERLAENAQIIFHLADSDGLPLIKAILKGMKARHDKTGLAPILIHTSGTAFVTDDARGEYATETIYNDTNLLQLMSVSPDALHRDVDLLILEADIQGYVNAHIVTPATIYGMPDHELAKAGLTNTHSIQIPALIKAALARGRAGMVGSGKALWASSHVEDVAALYIVIFDGVLRNPELSHGWRGFYYVGNDEHSWYDLSKKIGEAMVSLGLATDAEPTSFTPEELPKFFWTERFGFLWGSNCRVRATRGLALGWRPTHTAKDLLASIKPEVESLVKAQA